MTTPRRRIFVDVEATGLEVFHQTTECAWYDLSTGEHGVFIPPHSLDRANPYALKIHRYEERIAGKPVDDGTELRRFHALLGGDGTPTTFVAANPSFDTEKVAALFTREGLTPVAPWHHRKIDLSNMAYTLFPDFCPVGEVPGLKDVADILGIDLPEHHAALDDVFKGVECYNRLEALRTLVRIDPKAQAAAA